MWPAELSGYERILVTGPARSGTHLMADCLSLDFNRHVLYETAFDLDDLDAMLSLAKSGTVVQAPFLLPRVNELRDEHGFGVVISHRPAAAIMASQAKFDSVASNGLLSVPIWKRDQKVAIGYGGDVRDLPTCQYEWLRNQDQDGMFWVEYESLRSHVLWRDENRAVFGSVGSADVAQLESVLTELGLTAAEISAVTV